VVTGDDREPYRVVRPNGDVVVPVSFYLQLVLSSVCPRGIAAPARVDRTLGCVTDKCADDADAAGTIMRGIVHQH
jgi:hypothetical protein